MIHPNKQNTQWDDLSGDDLLSDKEKRIYTQQEVDILIETAVKIERMKHCEEMKQWADKMLEGLK